MIDAPAPAELSAAAAVPVLLIIFNRADLTRKLIHRLRDVKPARIYVAADGPRLQMPGDQESCQRSREMIDEIDWPCKIHRRYSATNQGCRWGPVNALDWFFQQESEGIILEDDVLPDPPFFWFCEELLVRNRTVASVGCICGYNFLPQEGCPSYFFSHLSLPWGWATWRDRWRSFSEVCERLEENLAAVKLNAWLSQHDARDFKRKVRLAYAEDHIWDFLWMFTLWAKNYLTVLPSRSLTRNIGIGERATHTKVETSFTLAFAEPMKFPLQHPFDVKCSRQIDQAIFRDLLHTPTLAERAKGVLRSGRPLGRLREIVLRCVGT